MKGDQVKRLQELEAENRRLRRAVSDLALEDDLSGGCAAKLLSPARRRACVGHVVAELGVPERQACRVLGQCRATQRGGPKGPDDGAALTAGIVRFAARYGYRRITALLRGTGWAVNRKRVERLWGQEGLKVPAKQPKKGRLWLHDGSCARLRPAHPDRVWSYDFVEDRTPGPQQAGHPSAKRPRSADLGGTGGGTHAQRDRRVHPRAPDDPGGLKPNSIDVVDVLADRFILRGLPGHIRSDLGLEFVAKAVRAWTRRRRETR